MIYAYSADPEGVKIGDIFNSYAAKVTTEERGSPRETGGGTCITVMADVHSLVGVSWATSGIVVANDLDPAWEVIVCHGEKTVAGADAKDGKAVTYGRMEMMVPDRPDPREIT